MDHVQDYAMASAQVGRGDALVMLLNGNGRTIAVLVDSPELFNNWWSSYSQHHYKQCVVMALPQCRLAECSTPEPMMESELKL